MRKGITPIISIIVLLLITIALAGLAYTYLSGYVSGAVEKSFIIPPGGAYCKGKVITVYVTNKGPSTLKCSDFQKVQVGATTDPQPRIKTGFQDCEFIAGGDLDDSLNSGTTGKLFSFKCTTNNVDPPSCSGSKQIVIGTSAGFQSFTVSC